MQFSVLYTDTSFRIPFQKKIIKRWILAIANTEAIPLQAITYVISSDAYLLELNQKHLDHDYFTDIITFDNTFNFNTGKVADICISIDRVIDNAKALKIETDTELLRVMAHGILHLCGFSDKNATDATQMRQKENAALALWDEINNALNTA